MKNKSRKAVEDLYEQRALPICDFVLRSRLTPEESMQTISRLAEKGYVKKHYGDSVVAMTHRGLKAGRKELISSLK